MTGLCKPIERSIGFWALQKTSQIWTLREPFREQERHNTYKGVCPNITRKQYDAAARSLRYSVVVPATLSVEAYPGQIISGTVQTQSKQYGHTLPIACLYEDNSGRQYVYVIIERETVRGKVLYAQQRTVFVLDKDAANFSYTTEIKEPLIVSQSRYLTDLCEVRMMIRSQQALSQTSCFL